MKKHYSANYPSKILFDCLAATANLIAAKEFTELSSTVSIVTNNVPLLVALSGGSDSTALLLALSKIAPLFGFQIIACHINHDLRGQESEQDAQFCKQLCKQLNVECQIIKLSLADLAKAKYKHASEDLLRELRYKYLTKFALSKNISFLLTAHTLDDQAETLLFRLFRGTSLSGLKGIEPCRNLGNNLYLLRPLLNLSKIECQNFLSSAGFAFREDSSNLNETYSRNYIRHKILPAITERFPDLSIHLNSLAKVAQAEDIYIDQIASQLFKHFQSLDENAWSVEIFKQQPLALQRRILAYALKERDIEVSFKRIDQLISLATSALPSNTESLYLNLNKHWRIKRIKDKFLWQSWQDLNNTINNCQFQPLAVNIPGINSLPELNSELLVEVYQENSPLFPSTESLQVNLDCQAIFADLSKIKPPLLLRQRRPGDRIQPLGMSQMVRLKKYLHTHKSGNRHHFYPQLVLADRDEVLWLPGIGISEKIKVIRTPSHILQWRQHLSAKR